MSIAEEVTELEPAGKIIEEVSVTAEEILVSTGVSVEAGSDKLVPPVEKSVSDVDAKEGTVG